MKTYCISRKDSSRRESLTERLGGIEFETFDAIDGAKLGLSSELGYYIDGKKELISAGHIGLYLSNLILWNLCLERNDEVILILEDDAVGPKNLQLEVFGVINSLPEDWQICRLSHGTCAMLYRKSVLPFVIERMTNICSAPIDVQLMKLVYPFVKYYEKEIVTNSSIGEPKKTELTRLHWSQIDGWFDYEVLYDEALGRVTEPAIFVEIGCWEGKSSAYMAEGIRKRFLPVTFYCIDPWTGSANDGDQLKRVAQLGGDMFPIWKRNMQLTGNLGSALPIQLPSVEAVKQFADGSVDFVWVDGSHSFEDASLDIRVWLSKLKPNGVIAGHDFDIAGVRRAVETELPGQYRLWKTFWISDPQLRANPGPSIQALKKTRLKAQTDQALESTKLNPQPHTVNRPKLVLFSCIHRSTEPIGIIDCKCSDPPKIHRCNHPQINAGCVRLLESGSRQQAILERKLAVCEQCSLREPEPGTVGNREEWKKALEATGITFKMPDSVRVHSTS